MSHCQAHAQTLMDTNNNLFLYPYNCSSSLPDINKSSKAQAVFDLFSKLTLCGDSVVVFSKYRRSLDYFQVRFV